MNRLWLFLLFILLQTAILFSVTDSQSQIYTINTRTSAVSSLIEGSPVVFTLDSSTQVILLKKVGQWGQVARVESQDVNGYVKLKYLSPIETVVSKLQPIEPESDFEKEEMTFTSGKLFKPTLKLSLLLAAIVLLAFLFVLRFKKSQSSSREKTESIEAILPPFTPLPPDELGRLPQYLDDFLFDILHAEHKPQGMNYYDPQNEEDLKRYLGTYFPRSFVEIQNIMNELFKSSTIMWLFEQFWREKTLKILDVGSGSGGNLLGLLDYLRSVNRLPEKIYVTSIDGDGMALKKQEMIINQFQTLHDAQIFFTSIEKKFESKTTFDNDLKSCLKLSEDKFDFIMTSKFIRSLYEFQPQSFGEGTYSIFCNFIEEHLTDRGLAFAIETTNPVKIRDAKVYFSQILNNEINAYIRHSKNLRIILPLSCAFYNKECKFPYCFSQKKYDICNSHVKHEGLDTSNVSFKVLAFKNQADKVLAEIDQKDKYIHIWKNGETKYCERGIKEGLVEVTIPDAFSIEHLKHENLA